MVNSTEGHSAVDVHASGEMGFTEQNLADHKSPV
jgi:hypothetical protein